ncbi:hypothetical protein F4859DRAFT_523916 [Xylaria cf. heliscus]|nr:hypothetical protein F4859DRAFT_523916 [Xylaria cf. heliscus]
MTQRLAERYLWIDSFGIVQDDNSDWENEAANMGAIFEQAICTIAAVDAIDDETGLDGGLYLPRVPDPLAVRIDCSHTESVEWPPEPYDPVFTDKDSRENTFQSVPFCESISNKDIVLRLRWKGLFTTMVNTQWYNRAWILQERILSRIIIYYTKRKVFWECRMCANDEKNIFNSAPPPRA